MSGAAGDISVEVVLQTRSVRFGIELRAPEEGRQQTRVNWLAKQLRGEPTPAQQSWPPRRARRVPRGGGRGRCLDRRRVAGPHGFAARVRAKGAGIGAG